MPAPHPQLRKGGAGLARILDPTDDLVIVNQAAGAEGLVVVQIRHPGHCNRFSDDRPEDVSAAPAPVDGYIITRSVDCSGDLAVPPEIHVRRQIPLGLHAVEKQIRRLIGWIEHSSSGDIDISGKIDFGVDSFPEDDLSGASD